MLFGGVETGKLGKCPTKWGFIISFFCVSRPKPHCLKSNLMELPFVSEREREKKYTLLMQADRDKKFGHGYFMSFLVSSFFACLPPLLRMCFKDK
jgi:hypothetical protein